LPRVHLHHPWDGLLHVDLLLSQLLLEKHLLLGGHASLLLLQLLGLLGLEHGGHLILSLELSHLLLSEHAGTCLHLGLAWHSWLADALALDLLLLLEKLGSLSSLPVGLLSLLFLLIVFDLVIYIRLQLTETLSRQLVKLELEDSVIILSHTFLNDGDDTFLLFKGQATDVGLESVLLLGSHWSQQGVGVDAHSSA